MTINYVIYISNNAFTSVKLEVSIKVMCHVDQVSCFGFTFFFLE
jgi:phosphoribosyl-AMP cyclohydrolase